MRANKNISLRQLSFAFESNRPDVEKRLADRMGQGVKVVYTDNARTMISTSRASSGTLMVRLHHMFRSADAKTLDALAGYIKNRDRECSDTLSQFFRKNNDLIRCRATSVRPGIETKGRFHDLAKLYEKVNEKYFGSRIKAAITWGQRARRRGRRHIRLGSYNFEHNLIRIHPSLDREWVPAYYIESVIHHEMLHADMGVRKNGGRSCYHTRDFRNGERDFEHHDRARDWEKKHLSRLI